MKKNLNHSGQLSVPILIENENVFLFPKQIQHVNGLLLPKLQRNTLRCRNQCQTHQLQIISVVRRNNELQLTRPIKWLKHDTYALLKIISAL